MRARNGLRHDGDAHVCRDELDVVDDIFAAEIGERELVRCVKRMVFRRDNYRLLVVEANGGETDAYERIVDNGKPQERDIRAAVTQGRDGICGDQSTKLKVYSRHPFAPDTGPLCGRHTGHKGDDEGFRHENRVTAPGTLNPVPTQTMKPETAAKKLGVYLPATPEVFREGPISRVEFLEMQAEPPEWLADLRRAGPHPRPVVAQKLGISISGLARGGVTDALTTAEIKSLLEAPPAWLVTERATQAAVRDDAIRVKSEHAVKAQQRTKAEQRAQVEQRTKRD